MMYGNPWPEKNSVKKMTVFLALEIKSSIKPLRRVIKLNLTKEVEHRDAVA
jgi:hypothetical protein